MADSTSPGETSESFQQQVFGMVSDGFVSLGIGIGSQLGLFDVMAGFSEPKTSQEIADAAGYKERYVREWLGLMAISKVINIDSEGKTFFIPPHRHSTLTGPGNLPRFASAIFIATEVQHDLMDCFRKDGPSGIPYSRYPGLHEWLDFKVYASPQELMKDIAKAPEIHMLLEHGAQVLDIGCSSGVTTEYMAVSYPKSCFTGIDIAEDAILRGQKRIQASGVENISLLVQDACNMPSDWTNKWDCIFTRSTAHDVPFVRQMFRDVYRTLKPGGMILLIEVNLHTNTSQNVGNPASKFFYTASLFHCVPVSLSQGGDGWGSTWGKEKVLELLGEAGFINLEIFHTKPMNFFCKGVKSSRN